MNKKNIIDGYNGIMPLDLTYVDQKYHKIMIDQHKTDIDLYKKEQYELPNHLQYENTIMRVEKVHKMDKYALKQRNRIFLEKQSKEDQLRIEIFYRNNKN